jgi:selenide,water dikinase
LKAASGIPVVRDLVLVGGGHSHVSVLRAVGMRPLAGVRTTLISRDYDTPYSGMLPGVVAGYYTRDQAHIDLVRLCRHCGVRFIAAEVTGLDVDRQEIRLAGRPPVNFDVLSLNTGSTPARPDSVTEIADSVIFTKPIDRFIEKWEELREKLRARSGARRIVIVGGGVAGVELALAVSYRLSRDGISGVSIALQTAGESLLETHTPAVRRRLARRLSAAGIDVRLNTRVEQVPDADAVIWATQAAPAPWYAQSGLAVDEAGFVAINEFLQSTSHDNVFAAGDTASSLRYPRPKAGVFAVRQGKPLARNLRRRLLGRKLQSFVPQKRFLSLIGTGDHSAVASRGFWSAEGHWVWRWKDRIDRRFMRKFSVEDYTSSNVPSNAAMALPEPGVLSPEETRELTGPHRDGMRCAGCGAKVAADVLSKALKRLDIDASDDAAVVEIQPDHKLVMSVDAFRPIVEDPWLFGRIAANHCLNDLYAMTAAPQWVLAQVTLPAWSQAKLGEELYQMLAGAIEVFSAAGAKLVGGHTGEGAEISLGFTVTGSAGEQQVRTKTGHQPGDLLVLTKPLGTGCLFAADMRAQARAQWVSAAIETMCLSNGKAAEILSAHGAHAVTDITGFGLAGHLLETIGDDPLQLTLAQSDLPILPGVNDALAAGWQSSLHDSNERWVRPYVAAPMNGGAILYDPQTAGPLVASLAADQAQAAVAALRAAGYRDATIIGSVAARAADDPIRMRLAVD